MSDKWKDRIIPLDQPLRAQNQQSESLLTMPLPSLLSTSESCDSDYDDFLDMESLHTTRIANTTCSSSPPRPLGAVERQDVVATPLHNPDAALAQISDRENDDIPSWTPFIPDDIGSINSQASDVSDLLSSVLSDDDDNNQRAYLTPAPDSQSDDSQSHQRSPVAAAASTSMASDDDQSGLESESAPPNRSKEDLENGISNAMSVTACTYPRQGANPSVFTICSCFCIVSLVLAVVGLTLALIQANNRNSASALAQSSEMDDEDASSLHPSAIASTLAPSIQPSLTSPTPSFSPTLLPTLLPSSSPTVSPSFSPSLRPTSKPTTTISPTTLAPTPMDVFEKAKLLRNFLIDQNYSSANLLDNLDTPQSQALSFMIEDDMVGLPIGDSTKDAFSSSETIMEWLERYVSSLLYYALAGDNWFLSLNLLNHSIPTCSWKQSFTFPGGQVTSLGVMCNSDSRVDSIQIVRNNLVGNLPEELGLLTQITSLILDHNPVLVGQIPSALSKLSAIQDFSCILCSLSGTVPSWIGSSWSNLRVLGLSQNTFVGSIPTSLSELTNLVVLGLDDNFLSGALDPLNTMPMLQQVYLDNNGFDGSITVAFLESASRLAIVDLSGNAMTGSVPVHLMALETFEILDLHGNLLSVFEDSIPENSNLTLLSLYENPIIGTVPTSISNLRALTHLDLTSTKFKGPMPELDNERLEYLFLAQTKFDRGSIPESFRNLTNLVDLSLKSSSRTGTIPTWIDGLDQLILLDLHLNSLTGTIPSALGRMSSLEFLLLNRNELSGEIPTDFPFANLLQIVFVEGNSLNGTMGSLCDSSLASLLAVVADCGADPPEITCSCCNVCCDDDDEDCNTLDALSVYDPDWEGGYTRRSYNFE